MMNHPTQKPNGAVNTVYKVIDKRDSYNQHTVAVFNSRTAAERFKDRAEREKGTSGALDSFRVSEQRVFSAPNEAADRL
jgi:hypothetical protein